MYHFNTYNDIVLVVTTIPNFNSSGLLRYATVFPTSHVFNISRLS